MAPVSPLAPHGATARIGKSGSGHFPRQPKIPGRDQEFGVSARQARAPASRGSASYLICFPEVIGEGRKLNRACPVWVHFHARLVFIVTDRIVLLRVRPTAPSRRPFDPPSPGYFLLSG